MCSRSRVGSRISNITNKKYCFLSSIVLDQAKAIVVYRAQILANYLFCLCLFIYTSAAQFHPKIVSQCNIDNLEHKYGVLVCSQLQGKSQQQIWRVINNLEVGEREGHCCGRSSRSSCHIWQL